MGWRKGCTVGPEDQAFQQGRGLGPGIGCALARAFGQDGMDLVPDVPINDRRMFAGIAIALVDGLTDVDPVVQQAVEIAFRDRLTLLGQHSARLQLAHQGRARSDFYKPVEDGAHLSGLGRIDDELAVLDVVSERHRSAHPQASHPAGPHLVADALGGDLSLELCKAEQDIEGQPPHGGRGIEALRDTDERHSVPVEHLDQLGEVHQRAD